MSEKNFALISVLRTMHASGNDQWAAISELVLAVMNGGDIFDELHRRLFSTYKYDLPKPVVRTALSRLKRTGLIGFENSDGPFSLTEIGKDKKVRLNDSSAQFSSEFNLLVTDLKKYLSSVEVTLKDAEKALITFMDDNLDFAVNPVTSKKSSNTDQVTLAIAQYVGGLESRNPAMFEILKGIFFGRLYLQTFNAKPAVDTNARFDPLSIYIDTNVALRLMGFADDPKDADALRALVVNLNKSTGVKVKILDVTIEEMKIVLMQSAGHISSRSDSVPTNDIVWQLRRMGYDRIAIVTFVEDLADRLLEFGVVTELSRLVGGEKTISLVRALAEKYLQRKTSHAIEHDATLVDVVHNLRSGKTSFLLEKSRAVLLTNDNALVKHAKEVASKNSTFPEAIGTTELTCLLWIKSINSDELMQASLRQALMVYARQKMVDSGLWDKFLAGLASAKQDKKLDDHAISLIINSGQVRGLLFEKGEDALDSVLDLDFIRKLEEDDKALRKSEKDKAATVLRHGTKAEKIINQIVNVIFYLTLVLVGTGLLGLALIFIDKLGIDKTGSWVGVGIPLIALLFFLLFGQKLNVGIITTPRERYKLMLHKKVKSLIDSVFY